MVVRRDTEAPVSGGSGAAAPSMEDSCARKTIPARSQSALVLPVVVLLCDISPVGDLSRERFISACEENKPVEFVQSRDAEATVNGGNCAAGPSMEGVRSAQQHLPVRSPSNLVLFPTRCLKAMRDLSRWRFVS